MPVIGKSFAVHPRANVVAIELRISDVSTRCFETSPKSSVHEPCSCRSSRLRDALAERLARQVTAKCVVVADHSLEELFDKAGEVWQVSGVVALLTRVLLVEDEQSFSAVVERAIREKCLTCISLRWRAKTLADREGGSTHSPPSSRLMPSAVALVHISSSQSTLVRYAAWSNMMLNVPLDHGFHIFVRNDSYRP